MHRPIGRVSSFTGMRYTLVHRGNEIRLRGQTILIGRSASCGVVVVDESVSRRHARLSLISEPAVIVDLDTPNGVYLNGKRIVRSAALASGDVIRIGEQELHFIAVPDGVGARQEAPPSPRSRDGLAGEDLTAINDATAFLCARTRHFLDLGEIQRAEETLGERWGKLIARGHAVHPALAIFAARTGFRLATATKVERWANDAAILLAAADQPVDLDTLTEIERMVAALGMTSAVRSYLREAAESVGLEGAILARIVEMLA
ncbi:MAG: FHA domain-containing protein [Myxococcales bacterium]|nr:FHA domain-containing protein [Myxococcales bacterium]